MFSAVAVSGRTALGERRTARLRIDTESLANPCLTVDVIL